MFFLLQHVTEEQEKTRNPQENLCVQHITKKTDREVNGSVKISAKLPLFSRAVTTQLEKYRQTFSCRATLLVTDMWSIGLVIYKSTFIYGSLGALLN